MGDLLEVRFREDQRFEFNDQTRLEEVVDFARELGKLAGERIDDDDPYATYAFIEVVDKLFIPTLRGWMLRVYAEGVAHTRQEIEHRAEHPDATVSQLHASVES